MSPADAKDWWVLGTGGNSGAVISQLPAGSPKDWKFFTGQPMRDLFPHGGTIQFSKKFPTLRKLLDSITSLPNIPIVSGKLKKILESFNPDDCEFLPVTILDHKGKLVSKDYYVLNLLRSEDIIDMERSSYDLDGFEKDQIERLRKLILKPHAVAPDARIFRAKTKMDQYFVHQSIVDAFERENVTGLRLFAAEGWDGDTM